MKKINLTPEESIQQNKDAWCYEVGSRFEQAGIAAAHHFMNFCSVPEHKKFLIELGCGDGSSTNEFLKNGWNIQAVDINEEKINKIKEINKNNFLKKNIIDSKSFLEKHKFIKSHIFTHHSLEHMVDADEIINLIGEKLWTGYLYYAIVPAGDYLHSVHHVVFESAEELLPNGFEPLLLQEQTRFGEKEFLCIAKKK